MPLPLSSTLRSPSHVNLLLQLSTRERQGATGEQGEREGWTLFSLQDFFFINIFVFWNFIIELKNIRSELRHFPLGTLSLFVLLQKVSLSQQFGNEKKNKN